MKKKIKRSELVELRKKELERKEMEYQVGRDLKHKYDRIEAFEKILKNKNPWVIGAINFFGTLVICYFPYFAFSLFIDFGMAGTILQIGFWVIAFISLIQKRSFLERFF